MVERNVSLCFLYPEEFINTSLDVKNGILFHETLDYQRLEVPSFKWYRIYNSNNRCIDRGLGCGFRHCFDQELIFEQDHIIFSDQYGLQTSFPTLKTNDQRYQKYCYTIERREGFSYRVFQQGEPVREFTFSDYKTPAKLTGIFDKNDYLSFRYSNNERLKSVQSSEGYILEIDWKENHINSVYFKKNKQK